MLLPAVFTLIAFAITAFHFRTFLHAFIEAVDPAEESAWFNTWTMYAAAAAFFCVSLFIGWFTEAMTYGQLGLLAAAFCGAMHWLSSFIPKFNFRKIEEAAQHNVA